MDSRAFPMIEAEARDRAEAHRQDVETIRGLRAAMQAASKTLKCPAAEYVPAMSEAWGILDNALAQSFKPHHAKR